LQQARDCYREIRLGLTHLTITTPEDGQAVAPGQVVQVCVRAVEPDGLRTVALMVGGAAVETRPADAVRRFPDGTTDSRTQVFTFRVKKDGFDPRDNQIVITAAAFDARGSSPTLKVIRLKVGGTDQDLVYTIDPAEPDEGQRVNVTLTVVNPRPGDKVVYSLVGTDGWTQGGPLTVRDGKATFQVPGARDGVVDRIEARIDGTTVVRRSQYTFR
jgi:hypothetical protein